MNLNKNKFHLLRPILAILILFIPLYPKFPLSTVKNTYVAIRLDDVLIAISVFFYFLHQLKNSFPIFKNKIFKLFLIYFLAISLSTLHALLILKTTPANILILHFLRRLEYMSLAFIAISAIPRKKDLNWPIPFFLLASFFVTIYGYGQKFLAWPMISTMNEEFSKGYILQLSQWSRINASFAGHYDLAVFLSVFLVIFLAYIFQIKKKITKIFLIIFWLLLFQLLIFTVSRVSLMAFWIGSIILLFFIKKKLWIIPISALIIFNSFKSVA
ncbi:hypothetical protein DRH14_05005, partial [Candidatus Shapirobacteria bacterium]